MNRISNDIHRLKTTGETRGRGGKVIQISKEEKAKHIHPKNQKAKDFIKRFKADRKDGGERC